MKGTSSKPSTISRFVATCMAVAALASFAACGKSSTGPDGTRVFGVVTNKGAGVAGVTISSAEGHSARSANNGWYEIHLPPGSHKLEFAKEGLEAVYRDVRVDGAEVNMNVEFEGASFTCAPGVRLEYDVSGAGRLEFDLTGAYDGHNKEHIAWAHEPWDYWRGGVSGGSSQWGLRTYKFKSYGIGGRDAQEPRYQFNWDGERTYHIVITWNETEVAVTVDGQYLTGTTSSFPTVWRVGLGWPSHRPGLDGAVFSNIKWPAGAVKVSP